MVDNDRACPTLPPAPDPFSGPLGPVGGLLRGIVPTPLAPAPTAPVPSAPEPIAAAVAGVPPAPPADLPPPPPRAGGPPAAASPASPPHPGPTVPAAPGSAGWGSLSGGPSGGLLLFLSAILAGALALCAPGLAGRRRGPPGLMPRLLIVLSPE